jgi:hypothetical protein
LGEPEGKDIDALPAVEMLEPEWVAFRIAERLDLPFPDEILERTPCALR